MRAAARIAVLAAAACGLAAPLAAAVTVSSEAPLVDTANASTSQVLGAEVFERLSSRSVNEILAILPSQVRGQPVDGATIRLDPGLPKSTLVDGLPTGWSHEISGGALNLKGPGLGEIDSIRVVVGGANAEYGKSPAGVLLFTGKTKVYDARVPIRRLNRVQLLGDPKGAIRLPQTISPGDPIEFRPLDPKFTPGAGTWRLGDLVPSWNGSFDAPSYRFEVPSDLRLDVPLRISYVDPWGVRLVDGVATDVTLRPATTTPSGSPAVTGCSAGVLAGDAFCVCGDFPTPEAAASLLLNGQPIGQYLVSASPTILNFQLPASFAPGPLHLDAARRDGFDIADGARGVLIRVRGEIDRNKLRRGQSTSLKLWLEGTDQPVALRLWNSTPGIVSLDGGNEQVVTTSGGASNEVARGVHAVSVGDFGLHFALDVGSCPCAEGPVEQILGGGGKAAGAPSGASGGGTSGGTSAPAAPGAGFSDADLAELEQILVTGTDPVPPLGGKLGATYARSFFAPGSADGCAVTKGDCDELLRRALEAEATARALRAAAERARENQKWMDQQADALDREIEADGKHLETLRRQAAEYRDLERAAAESLATNERRAREYPQGNWGPAVDFDRKEVARRGGEAARLEAEAQALEAEIAAQRELAAKLRGTADGAEAAARVAEALARAARAAYEACLARLASECPTLVGGGSTVATTSGGGAGGGASRPPEDAKGDAAYCGPDVSNAFTAALARVHRRMKELPASEKGALAGALFLQRNGWNIDQWPLNPIPGSCPTGPCANTGNERGQDCYRLFGRCVPAHVLNDTMFGFTAELLGVPEEIQDLGGNWAEGSFNLPDAEKAKYTPNVKGYLYAWWNAPDPAASRSSYRTGNAIAEAWSGGDFQTGPELGQQLADSGLLDDLLALYPSLAQCRECPSPEQVTEWISSRDWSRAEWRLSDGTPVEEGVRRALGVSP